MPSIPVRQRRRPSTCSLACERSSSPAVAATAGDTCNTNTPLSPLCVLAVIQYNGGAIVHTICPPRCSVSNVGRCAVIAPISFLFPPRDRQTQPHTRHEHDMKILTHSSGADDGQTKADAYNSASSPRFVRRSSSVLSVHRPFEIAAETKEQWHYRKASARWQGRAWVS
eukprot:COSAG02_NODE_15743_length_1144_cov_1.647847_2_plen_169_part_00